MHNSGVLHKISPTPYSEHHTARNWRIISEQNSTKLALNHSSAPHHSSVTTNKLRWIDVSCDWAQLHETVCQLPVTLSTIVDSVTGTASLSHRGRLRSASSQRYEQPRTRLKFGERCFAFAGLAAWLVARLGPASLPSSVQELTNTSAFKHQLKTVLFQRCYSSST